jgi:hypothetical protein
MTINLCVVVLRDIILCSLVRAYQHFRGRYFHHLQDGTSSFSLVGILHNVTEPSKTVVTTRKAIVCVITTLKNTAHIHTAKKMSKLEQITHSASSNSNKLNTLNLVLLIQLIPWIKIFIVKLTVIWIVKKFVSSYGTWRFIVMFTAAHYQSLSWARGIQSTPSTLFP